jgi:hypothetical protein
VRPRVGKISAQPSMHNASDAVLADRQTEKLSGKKGDEHHSSCESR